MAKIVFFTLNNFQKEGGGTIRMLGIINELAKHNDEIILMSNIKDKSKVSPNVQHIALETEFSPEEKRKFQFLLGAFGYSFLNRAFSRQLESLGKSFSKLNSDDKVIFFEYLDNSIGYWLKKNNIIPSYINDIHGIASNEFIFQRKKAKSLLSKLFLKVKEKIAMALDKKVFNDAEAIIYASAAMDDYYKNLYPSLRKKNNIFLPYVLNNANVKAPDNRVIQKIKADWGITDSDFVFLFAGAYKETGGIQDLMLAFDKIAPEFPEAKLILVGDGPTFENCKTLKESLSSSERILQMGRQPYNYLSSFQEIANVLVCPDRQNLFSDLIVHVKYLDALISGKIVINGSFKSVMEINSAKKLSLLFKPSDIDDLGHKMKDSIKHYVALSFEFSDSKQYALDNLTYSNYIQNLNSITH